MEILEQAENPLGFLTNVRSLLARDGVAVLRIAKLEEALHPRGSLPWLFRRILVLEALNGLTVAPIYAGQ
jgi:hypothetical protein